MIDLTQVLTFSEAAEIWGLANGNTLRKAVERNRFLPGEVRKSGDVWLTTYDAMKRLYGEPKLTSITISQKELTTILYDAAHHQNIAAYEQLLHNFKMVLQQNQEIIVTETDASHHVVMQIKTMDELNQFLDKMERFFLSVP